MANFNYTARDRSGSLAVLSALLAFLLCGCGLYLSKPRTSSVKERASLRPHDLLNTCAMVVLEKEVKGTGFFVTSSGSSTSSVYFVTARHVAEALTNSFAMWPRVTLKLKRQGGQGAAYAFVPVGKISGAAYWYQYPRSNADLAVFPVPNIEQLTNEGFDIRPIDFSGEERSCDRVWNGRQEVGASDRVGYLSGHVRRKHGVEAGYEVVMLGASPELIKNAAESEFLLTIRKGWIAAVPHVAMRYYYGPTRLIILDCPVLAGNSGGPVFVWISGTEQDGACAGKSPKLLGVVSSMAQDRTLWLPNERRPFQENSGFSHITPGDEVADILRYLDGEHRSLQQP